MGSATSRSNTHVANAVGKPLRIFYEVDKMRLEEMVIKYDAGIQAKGETSSSDKSATGDSLNVNGEISASYSGTFTFKPDSRVRFICVPIGECLDFAGEGSLYVSVFVEECEKSCSQICQNFLIPCNRSFIVAADRSILFQKYGESPWIDELGVNHHS